MICLLFNTGHSSCIPRVQGHARFYFGRRKIDVNFSNAWKSPHFKAPVRDNHTGTEAWRCLTWPKIRTASQGPQCGTAGRHTQVLMNVDHLDTPAECNKEKLSLSWWVGSVITRAGIHSQIENIDIEFNWWTWATIFHSSDVPSETETNQVSPFVISFGLPPWSVAPGSKPTCQYTEDWYHFIIYFYCLVISEREGHCSCYQPLIVPGRALYFTHTTHTLLPQSIFQCRTFTCHRAFLRCGMNYTRVMDMKTSTSTHLNLYSRQ